MLPLACLLLLAASRVQLVDQVDAIPAKDWRWIELGLNQRPALVTATYEVISGPPSLRLALLSAADAEKLKEGAPHGVLELTTDAARGGLNYQVREPGNYVLVIDNQGDQPASVRTRVWLDFARRGPLVTQLSPRRQFTIVVISFAVFFGIVSFSARRLLKLVRR
jgi:hypothetical protein